jgi:hypothetical protein
MLVPHPRVNFVKKPTVKGGQRRGIFSVNKEMVLDSRVINQTKKHAFNLKYGEGNCTTTSGIDGTGFVNLVRDIQSYLQTGNEGAIMCASAGNE